MTVDTEELRAAFGKRLEAQCSPEDIRAAGWELQSHYDWYLGGERRTRWVFAKDGRCAIGDGYTDKDALNVVRNLIEASDPHTLQACIARLVGERDRALDAATAITHELAAVKAELARERLEHLKAAQRCVDLEEALRTVESAAARTRAELERLR
jgi:hypothetical protein